MVSILLFFFFFAFFCEKKELESTCSSDEYFDGNLCLPCDVSCLNCTGPGQGRCDKCKDGYFFWDPETARNFDWYHGDYGCNKCNERCSKCYMPGWWECIKCANGYWKEITLITLTSVCKHCNESCASCYGPENFQCHNCSERYYPKYTKNVLGSKSMRCLPCNEHCLKCVNGTGCEICEPGYAYDNYTMECVLFNCTNLNNCSGNGNCSGIQICKCSDGWTGLDCSESLSNVVDFRKILVPSILGFFGLIFTFFVLGLVVVVSTYILYVRKKRKVQSN